MLTTVQFSEATKNLYGKFSLTDEEISSLTYAQILERAAERREVEILIHVNNYLKKYSIHEEIEALQGVYIEWMCSNFFKENEDNVYLSEKIINIQKLLISLAQADTWALPDAVKELNRKRTIENQSHE